MDFSCACSAIAGSHKLIVAINKERRVAMSIDYKHTLTTLLYEIKSVKSIVSLIWNICPLSSIAPSMSHNRHKSASESNNKQFLAFIKISLVRVNLF